MLSNRDQNGNTIVTLISKVFASLMTIVAIRILGVTLRIHEPLLISITDHHSYHAMLFH